MGRPSSSPQVENRQEVVPDGEQPLDIIGNIGHARDLPDLQYFPDFVDIEGILVTGHVERNQLFLDFGGVNGLRPGLGGFH